MTSVYKAVLAILLIAVGGVPASAQAPIRFSSTAFGDYYYAFSSPDDEFEDMNGFTLRRLYITADFDLPDAFDGRARLEANSGTVGSTGMETFVKDLWLRWRSEGGHAIRIGILPTPHWETSEAVWGYRSLDATVMDVLGIATSRDFGIRVDGPILEGGALEYSVAFGNNNHVRPEVDRTKRVYGALTSRPSDRLVIGLSADYAGYDDAREQGITVHALAGFEADRFTIGVEPFWNQIEFESDGEMTRSGVSLFGHLGLADRWRIIGRVDVAEHNSELADIGSVRGIIALSFEPNQAIRLIPNVWINKIEGDDEADVRGRFTFEYRF